MVRSDSLHREIFHDAKTDTIIHGKIIGTEGFLFNDSATTREAVFDGNLLTAFDCAKWDHGYIGVDFRKPVKIDRITFTPRGDGNSIGTDNLYALCVWYNNKWIELQRKIATDVVIRFDSVPSNGLYIFHNLTKGREERPFTYKNGKQVWW